MDSTTLIIICSLYIGSFVTWSTETFGSLVKLLGMQIKSNLISASVVQSISIFSRLGFFLQTLAIAWLVDERILIDSRVQLVFGYLLVTLITVFVTHRFGFGMLERIYKYIIARELKNLQETPTQLKHQPLPMPSALQVIGYLMLYTGGFLPILVQLAIPEFAARGVALASIINGISTIILISYYELKTSIDIHKSGVSKIPAQLLSARYAALSISLMVGLTIFVIARNI